MKIVFAGTPEFAAIHLQSLLDNSSHQIVAVYTQPDRPAGRGRGLTPSPVKQIAETHQIPVKQPKTLRDEAAQAELKNFAADIMVVVAYGLILPKQALDSPKHGCINVHASLLPRWRGAAPIQHAILAGDTMTGVNIMQMDEGLDTGDILYETTCPIEATDTGSSLHDKLAALGAIALLETLTLIEQNKLQPKKQNHEKSTYASKLTKQQAEINWNMPADNIARQVRAFNAWPIAYTHFAGQVVRIWEAEVKPAENAAQTPGNILDIQHNHIDVDTAKDILRITKLQVSGGKVLSVQDLLNGRKLSINKGAHFD